MNFRKVKVFIFICCIIAAIALGAISLANPNVPGAPEVYQAEFQVYTTDIGYVSYHEGENIETFATFRNEHSEKLWLSSDIWLEYFNGAEYIKIDADINNTGVVAIMPGEVVSFCSIIPAECIHEKIEPGDYRIIREVFIDEKLTKSAGYAEHIFNVQNSIE